MFTAPCRWIIRQTYKSDRIPKQLTEVYCLGNGSLCDANPRYQVKNLKFIFVFLIYLLKTNFFLTFLYIFFSVFKWCLAWKLLTFHPLKLKYITNAILQWVPHAVVCFKKWDLQSPFCHIQFRQSKSQIVYYLYVFCDKPII